MNYIEAGILLAFAAAFDHREVDEADAEAWQLALADVELEDCREAVIIHYRQHDRRIMPADIRGWVISHRPPPDPGPPRDRVADDRAVPTIMERLRADVEAARDHNRARRERVLRFPDLAARLCEPPLNFKHPNQWNGYVPPQTLSVDDEPLRSPAGRPNQRHRRTDPQDLNMSPERAALVEICGDAHVKGNE